MVRIKLTQANEAYICKIGFLVGKPACNLEQTGQMVRDVQNRCHQPLSDEIESQSRVFEMKRCLCQNRVAREERFRHLSRKADCPLVMEVVTASESD